MQLWSWAGLFNFLHLEWSERRLISIRFATQSGGVDEVASKPSEQRMNAGFDTSLRSYSTGVHPKIKQPCGVGKPKVYCGQ